jgi:polyhydroxyalkanoate synthase
VTGNPINEAIDLAFDIGEHWRDRLADSRDNLHDWLFERDRLVKSGLTPFEQILQCDPMTVRHYSLAPGSRIALADGRELEVARQTHALPLILVPPLGVTSEVFDLLPQRSLVRYMAARGFRTYLIDWGRPRRRHAHFGLRHYACDLMSEALAAIRQHSASREVSMMGWCMGGLIGLIHLGLDEDAAVRNLVTVASPIDLHGGGLVARAARALDTPAQIASRFGGPLSQAIGRRFDVSRLHAPGWMTTLAFKLTNPLASITTYWDLLTRFWDREFVERHTTIADYLNNMLLYPGGVVRDVVLEMAMGNKLGEGRVRVGRQESDFRNIRANLLAFAGEGDHLVPPSIARRSLELVASKDREFQIAPGGHMGVILGGQAQMAVWEKAADWLVPRSVVSARRQHSRKER